MVRPGTPAVCVFLSFTSGLLGGQGRYLFDFTHYGSYPQESQCHLTSSTITATRYAGAHAAKWDALRSSGSSGSSQVTSVYSFVVGLSAAWRCAGTPEPRRPADAEAGRDDICREDLRHFLLAQVNARPHLQLELAETEPAVCEVFLPCEGTNFFLAI